MTNCMSKLIYISTINYYSLDNTIISIATLCRNNCRDSPVFFKYKLSITTLHPVLCRNNFIIGSGS